MPGNNTGNSTGIPKMPTGIEGVDEITEGGLPRDRTSVIFGRPGSGKTIFALQTLVNGARAGENGIFVTFEEPAEFIKANVATLGWDLDGEFPGKIAVVDARLFPQTFTSGDFDTEGLLAGLTAKAREMEARRIVFDSIDTMLILLRDPLLQRRELYRILDWARASKITTLVTVRQTSHEPFSVENFDFLHFMANCALTFNYRIQRGVSNRSLRVLKYRGSGFAENEFPLLISDQGIEVASLGSNIEGSFDYPTSSQRITTGVDDLDRMLGGGFFCGSSTLVTGHPGTGKSTLCSAFLLAAARRGERSLYISFDEGTEEILRNMESVRLPLRSCVEAGTLVMKSIRSEAHSAEEYLMIVQRLVTKHRPECLVIDPLSAVIKGQDDKAITQLAQRLMHLTKRAGITLVCTSLLDRNHPAELGTPLEVSTVADTWIHLEYLTQAGERNRTLTIIKARGVGHSNKVRELIFSDRGIRLADVSIDEGEVLMGSRRMEKEREDTFAHRNRMDRLAHKEKEEEFARAELEAQVKRIEQEMEQKRLEIEHLRRERESWEEQWKARHLQERTGAEKPPLSGETAPGGDER